MRKLWNQTETLIQITAKNMERTLMYLIFYSLILSLFFSIAFTFPSITVFPISAIAISIVLVIFVLISIRFLIRSKYLIRLSERRFLTVVVSFAFLIAFISVVTLSSEIGSDFLVYHQNATKLLNGKLSWNYVLNHLDNPYYCRPLVNLVPVYWLFGTTFRVAQLFNIFLHLSTGILLYFFVKDTFKSRLLSRLSIIIFFLFPILYLYLNITSHDITGMFYLMLSFFLFDKLNKALNSGKNIKRLFLVSALFGISIIITHLSRGFGDMIYYALLLMLLLFIFQNMKYFIGGQSNFFYYKKLIFLFLFPLLIYHFGLNTLGAGRTGREFHRFFITTDTKNHSHASYSQIADYGDCYSKLIKDGEQNQLAYGKISSELYYNYQDYIQMIIRKNNVLYTMAENGIRVNRLWLPTKNKSFSNKFRTIIIVYSKALRIILFFFSIIGAIYLMRKTKFNETLILILLFWFFLSSALIFLGELNQRYGYVFFLNLSFLSAVGMIKLSHLFKKPAMSFMQVPLDWKAVYRSFRLPIMLLSFVIVVFAFGFVFKKLVANSDVLYKDLRKNTIKVFPYKNDGNNSAFVRMASQEAPIKFGMNIPVGVKVAQAKWRFKVDPDKFYTVRGFIKKNHQKYLKQNILTMISVNDSMILPNTNTYLKKMDLKIQKSKTISYFSSNPVYCDSNILILKFAIKTDKSVIENYEQSKLTTTFLEFVQISEIELASSNENKINNILP